MYLIGKQFKVLNDGFVALEEVNGSDESILKAARVTSQKLDKNHTVLDDENLIRYLMRHRHTTPFEFGGVVLHIRCPMDVWRQWIRHRTASVNEYSTRYTEAIDSKMTTGDDEWREQATNNRQGSGGYLPAEIGRSLSVAELAFHEAAENIYQSRLSAGVAKEQARKDLPLSTYTEAFWKINLHNLIHFLGLRMDGHAQWEIRQFANVIGHEIVATIFPLTWEAFKDYHLEAMTFSATEVHLLKNLLTVPSQYEKYIEDYQPARWLGVKQCRERDEFIAKLKRLKLIP